MGKEMIISLAQVVQAVLTSRGSSYPVLGATAVAREPIIALDTLPGKAF
jgi:hypothetical protein